MKHTDFAIGTEFETCTGQRWRCTDVGRRTIVAIALRPELETAWFCGPPYAVSEVVFDEQDIVSAFRHLEQATRDAFAEIDRALHSGSLNEAINAMTKACSLDEADTYPHPRLLLIDRVDAAGEILHPYTAEPVSDGWRILLYAPFTGAFSTLPEAEFIRLRPATSHDLDARKQAFDALASSTQEYDGAQARK